LWSNADGLWNFITAADCSSTLEQSHQRKQQRSAAEIVSDSAGASESQVLDSAADEKVGSYDQARGEIIDEATINKTLEAAHSVKEKLLHKMQEKMDPATVERATKAANVVLEKTKKTSAALKRRFDGYANSLTKSPYFQSKCKEVFETVDIDKVSSFPLYRALGFYSYRIVL
jgi:cellobiose-specific phosphotransferase system component IIA